MIAIEVRMSCLGKNGGRRVGGGWEVGNANGWSRVGRIEGRMWKKVWWIVRLKRRGGG